MKMQRQRARVFLFKVDIIVWQEANDYLSVEAYNSA